MVQSGSQTTTVTTLTDTKLVQHGTINIAIDDVSNADYEVTTSSSAQEINVKVRDQVVPVVSITSDKNNLSITEGETFTIRLVSVPAPVSDITVELAITEGSTGHFNRLSQSNPITISDSGVIDISVHTNSTTTRELGQLGFAVVSNDITIYSKSSTAGSISVGIKDAVKSVVSISSTKNNGVVNEGDSFDFRLSATPAPLEEIMVDITAVDQGTGHLGVLSDSGPVEIGTSGTADVTVTTIVDTVNIRHGAIDISLDEVVSQDYEVSSVTANKAIQVKIKDSVKPVISISSTKNNQIITEGGSFEFSLEASFAPVIPILVDLDINDSGLGHFKGLAPIKPISISGTDPVNVTLSTNDTTTAEQGIVQVAINEGDQSDYTASSSTNSIQVKIKDTVKPVVSISSTKNNQIITEGGSFEFSLEASFSPVIPILVDLDINDSGLGHFKGLAPIKPISISGTDPVNVTLSTNDTTTAEQGIIQVAINEGDQSDYTASSSTNSIQVKIKDTVKPVVSIALSQNNEVVTEGTSFAVTLTSVPAPISPIMVGITGTNSDTSHLGTLVNQVEIGTSGTKSITVPTQIEANHERHGNIAIALNQVTNAAYEVSTTLSEQGNKRHHSRSSYTSRHYYF